MHPAEQRPDCHGPLGVVYSHIEGVKLGGHGLPIGSQYSRSKPRFADDAGILYQCGWRDVRSVLNPAYPSFIQKSDKIITIAIHAGLKGSSVATKFGRGHDDIGALDAVWKQARTGFLDC